MCSASRLRLLRRLPALLAELEGKCARPRFVVNEASSTDVHFGLFRAVCLLDKELTMTGEFYVLHFGTVERFRHPSRTHVFGKSTPVS